MSEAVYRKLDAAINAELENRLGQGYLSPFACKDGDAIRRKPEHGNVLRPAFIRDNERILNDKHYNRYADKTQVFSFYKNDDITRRALHVQLVSRIARNIGRALSLNLDLIEAIALGHDIGHTPFGHAGEHILNELYHKNTGRYFHHNVHSVRVLDDIYQWNLCLQTLDGILCHNGELPKSEYRPQRYNDFETFDRKYESCYTDRNAVASLIPSTLEGCVVRMSDIIAYLGKDRQDAIKAKMSIQGESFMQNALGQTNGEIIYNAVCDIVESSFDCDYIKMSPALFDAFSECKRSNAEEIYSNSEISEKYDSVIKPMFERIYGELLDALNRREESSVLYQHYLLPIRENPYINGVYSDNEPNRIITDYIASMTDDYFIDLYGFLFHDEKYTGIEYVSYFHNLDNA